MVVDGEHDMLNNESFMNDNTDNIYIANEIDDLKNKRKYEPVFDHSEDDLPYKYRHVRTSIKGVRPEIYTAYSKMASIYHMLHRQIQGAITTVANELFGRKKIGEWKMFNEKNDESFIVNNTLPFPVLQGRSKDIWK